MATEASFDPEGSGTATEPTARQSSGGDGCGGCIITIIAVFIVGSLLFASQGDLAAANKKIDELDKRVEALERVIPSQSAVQNELSAPDYP